MRATGASLRSAVAYTFIASRTRFVCARRAARSLAGKPSGSSACAMPEKASSAVQAQLSKLLVCIANLQWHLGPIYDILSYPDENSAEVRPSQRYAPRHAGSAYVKVQYRSSESGLRGVADRVQSNEQLRRWHAPATLVRPRDARYPPAAQGPRA